MDSIRKVLEYCIYTHPIKEGFVGKIDFFYRESLKEHTYAFLVFLFFPEVEQGWVSVFLFTYRYNTVPEAENLSFTHNGQITCPLDSQFFHFKIVILYFLQNF